MLSRVADNLYWMRRYVERGHHIARVVSVNLDLTFDRAPMDLVRLWGRLLSGVAAAPQWASVDHARTGGAMTDLTSMDAVASCFAAARENARQVREHITGDMWEQLNRVHLALNDSARRAEWAARPHGYFQTVREGAALFDAAVHAGLAREEGWHFLQLGLFLERAGGTARLLACQVRETLPAIGSEQTLDQHLEWICLLRACDGLELYRRRCGSDVLPDRVVRFLIADPVSPQSVRYALDHIAAALAALAAALPRQTSIALADDVIAAVHAADSRNSDPMSLVAAVEAECNRVHSQVYQTYIDHRQAGSPAAAAGAGS